jgi:hypothetical protein
VTKPCAIVGGGLASLVAYATLRKGGLEPAEIDVFGTDTDPAAAFRRRTAAIRQRSMRSESDGHCLPATFPGLAVRAAARRRHPLPLLATIFDRFHPTLVEFLDHVDEVRGRSGWDESLRLARIGSLTAVDDGFELEGQGVYCHVLLAPGHPGLAFPEGLEGLPRVAHAYEPHEYADDVEIVGAGMAAATEWLNALTSGARVTSVRRREPERRPLNLPRHLFTRRGLAAYHRLPGDERVAALRRWSAPSYPPGRAWDQPVLDAARKGRFRVAAELNGAEQVICATGFKRGFQHDPLLARLADEHGLETADNRIVLAPDATVPALTNAQRTLALAGAPAQWAFPAADTLAGFRYVAHRFVARVKTCRTR